MKSVRVYYAGIPKKNNNPEKFAVLQNFHLGVPDKQSTEVHNFDYQPCDLAVIQGWVQGTKQTSPHLMFRQNIINGQSLAKKHTLAIDSNLFLYRDPANTKKYLRFSLDGIFPTTGNYFTDKVDPARWESIRNDLNMYLKPRSKGRNILICLQRNGGWSMGDVNVVKWCNDTITMLRKHSDRPIIVRVHPGDNRAVQYIRFIDKNVKISTNKNILDDFEKSWATITYNSSPGVASMIEGVPVFVTDPEPRKSQAFDVCNTDLSKIENPVFPDRQEWVEKLAMSHFNFEELKNGTAWNIIKDYI